MSASTLMAMALILMLSFSPTAAQSAVDEHNSGLRGALKSSPPESTPAHDKDFFSDVESALGTNFLDSNKDRMAEILKALQPTFASLSKNEYGKLGDAGVRYILHRLFVARHGWLMKGLDPAGQQFGSASPVQALEGKAAKDVEALFEKRLAAQGFGLQELAVFASVLESLVSEETSEKLDALFEKMQVSKDAKLTHAQAIDMIEFYMVDYIIGDEALKKATKKALIRRRQKMSKIYSFWTETQKLIRQVCEEVLGSPDQVSFADVSRVLVVIGERFGKWQNVECQGMKKRLMDLEAGEQGCVPLSNFYRRMVHSGGSDWQFGESLDYLKTNGIIDEFDPDNTKLMIANYVNGPANCIATSKYYAVCCIDECESLMGHIETSVGGPKAVPHELAALVAGLPSSTVAANRTLPPSQLHRLQKIAETHDGYVPLHGRLFMQWMHMVYPRECAYPHLAGSTKPLTPAAWIQGGRQFGSDDRSSGATDEEMRRFVDAPAKNTTMQSSQGQCGRWVDEEELYISGQTSQRRNLHELEADAQTWLAASSVALMCVLAAMTLVVIQTGRWLKNALFPSWMQDKPLMHV